MAELKTVRMRVYGIVQGVGFRPTVSRHAISTGVRGCVSNMGPYVEIYAQGSREEVDSFTDAVVNAPPVRAVILKADLEEIPQTDERYRIFDSFDIITSEKKTGEIFVSPDIATCDQCRKELFDPSNRRYLHPFINCTCCGPRLTILDGMPYDRVRTSMAEFPMCPQCHAEYTDPQSRRYDAQPVCCNECGPYVYLLEREEKGEEAIKIIRHMIADGKIVAIKGIGGFHLCCDASNEEAVARLRQKKKRPVKPFAVMMKDMDTVRRECIVTKEQEEMLTGHQKPIILLERKNQSLVEGTKQSDGMQAENTESKQQGGKQAEASGPRLCQSTAPGNPKIGIMLPYAPVQMLLFDYPGDNANVSDCLIMTSGNTSGAPICRDDEDAGKELGYLCDAVLSHNRLIRLRADDTVMDYYENKPYMIRRSRGFSPLPFMFSNMGFEGSVLAVGGELKNTFCISKNDLFYPSPYIGDMEDVRTVRAHTESVRRMEELLEASPQVIVCDMHPGYHTTQTAEELQKKMNQEILKKQISPNEGSEKTDRIRKNESPEKTNKIELLKVQHHYAHLLSCMAENQYPGPVIGLSFDGTGYGEDKSIWGGEIMTCDLDGYKREASIQPFIHAGGDLASREGWRIAVSLMRDFFLKFLEGDKPDDFYASLSNSISEPESSEKKNSDILSDLISKTGISDAGKSDILPKIISGAGLCDEKTAKIQLKMIELGINSIKSTSAGRLFDAVSAVLGICLFSTYEGDASTKLEFAAEHFEKLQPEKAREIKKEIFAGTYKWKVSGFDYDFGISEPLDEKKESECAGGPEEEGVKSECAGGPEEDSLLRLRTTDLFGYLVLRRMAGDGPEILSYIFHTALAVMAGRACCLISQKNGIRTAALSGGVYQNQLLLRQTDEYLKEHGFVVLKHSLIPPNDGGLCLGQAVYGARYLAKKNI